MCRINLCPTTAHLKTFWTMAYDQFPLDVRRVKSEILNDAADRRLVAVFAHDPQIKTARLIRNPTGELVAEELSKPGPHHEV